MLRRKCVIIALLAVYSNLQAGAYKLVAKSDDVKVALTTTTDPPAASSRRRRRNASPGALAAYEHLVKVETASPVQTNSSGALMQHALPMDKFVLRRNGSIMQETAITPTTQDGNVSDIFPTVGMTLELHFGGVALNQIHNLSRSAVAEFLGHVQKDLQRGSVAIKTRVVGMVERFKLSHDENAVNVGSRVRINEEVVVKLKVGLHGTENSTRSVEEVSTELLRRIADPTGGLRESQLAFALGQISITPELGRSAWAPIGEFRTTMLGALALPLLTSTVFTGIFVWLAAW